MNPAKLPTNPKVKGTIRAVLGGRFFRHEYEGTITGKTRSGDETIAFNAVTKRFQTSWVDDFHRAACGGPRGPDSRIPPGLTCSDRGKSARDQPTPPALPRGLSRGKIVRFFHRAFRQIAHGLMVSPAPTSFLHIKAALAYFALVFGAGFMMGVVRVPLVVPRVGERVAELMEMPIMLLVIIFAARYIVSRFALPPTAAARLAVGLFALGLLLSAEGLLAVIIQDRSIGEYIASRDPVSGSVYLLMLAVYATMPVILARLSPARA